MSYLFNNQQKFNDVVFEHRNKNYGAYAIRSAYGNTLFKSLSLMCLVSGTLVSIAVYLSRPARQVHEVPTDQVIPDVVYELPVDLKQDEPPAAADPTPPKPQPSAASAALSTNIVDSLTAETHSQALQAELPATASTSSASSSIDGSSLGTGTNSSGTGSLAGLTSSVQETYKVDSQPEFEGGLKALYKFVSDHLRYPPPAIEAGMEGTVYVKFVVDETGKVGSLSLLNNQGFGMDDEARRVVALIPNFKTPAKIQSVPVKVYYQLPIRFKLR